METNEVGLEPQNTPDVDLTTQTGETVSLSKTEVDDLKHKAEVSSQNFERAKKAELELKRLKEALQTNEVSPDDTVVRKIAEELSEVKDKLAKAEVQTAYPLIKEAWNDFEEFRSQDENKGMNMRTAAKAFLVEKGLLEPARKGLEPPTGGPRVPVSTGMSNEDIKKIRETDSRKYEEMVRKGEIKFQ